MAQLDKTFPTNDCSMCILSPKFIECAENPNISIMTNTRVEAIEGEAGSFEVRLVEEPRYVDEEKCTHCRLCGEICQYSAIVCIGDKVLVHPELCHSCGGCALVCRPGAIAEAPRVRVQFLVNGEELEQKQSDLPAPDSSGAIPVLVNAAIKPGNCEIKITALQGFESTTRSVTYTVPAQ